RPPFAGGNTLEKLVRHATEDVPPVERLRPEVPPAVAAVVRRLMAKRPEDRYPTPADLAAALAPFCRTALPSPVRPPSSPFFDGPATPAGGTGHGGAPPEAAAGDDLSVLAGTVAPGNSATALGTTHLPSHPGGGQPTWRERRVWVALIAAAVAGGLLAAGAAG